MSQVLQVFYLWAEDIESQRVDCNEISRWKDCLHDLDNPVLPTVQDKWVSLHPKFGVICWYDDAELGKQFKHCNGVYFLRIDAGGKRNKTKAKNGVQTKLITFIRAMGIPSLSEVCLSNISVTLIFIVVFFQLMFVLSHNLRVVLNGVLTFLSILWLIV